MSDTKTTQIRRTQILLWDLPVRLFHWLTVALVFGLWASHAFDRMDLHIKLGMALLFLVTFRIAWGFLGSDTARFARFVKGPAAILAYLRTGRAPDGGPVVGHNPLGALSVLGLLGILAAQIGLGLFATDTDATSYGPLNSLISYEAGEKVTQLHEIGFNLILLLVVIHLGAIIYYAVKKKDRLIPPMITGQKTYDTPVTQPKSAPWWRLVIALALALALCDYVWNGGSFNPKPKPLYDVSY
jgi:cytochrome b